MTKRDDYKLELQDVIKQINITSYNKYKTDDLRERLHHTVMLTVLYKQKHQLNKLLLDQILIDRKNGFKA